MQTDWSGYRVKHQHHNQRGLHSHLFYALFCFITLYSKHSWTTQCYVNKNIESSRMKLLVLGVVVAVKGDREWQSLVHLCA